MAGYALANLDGADQTIRSRRKESRSGFMPTSENKEWAMQSTAWADGLRGIAAVFVVSSHIALCIARALVNPCCKPGSESPMLFQRPFLRLVSSGHSWVAIFFLLMGFVNSLRPLQLARNGEKEEAASKLATSGIGRVLRLVLPGTFATIFSWLLCQLHFYEAGRHSDAWWLSFYSAYPSKTYFDAITDLKDALRDTWTLGVDNSYDQPQWALIYLLEGSLIIILALAVTINMTPLWRTLLLLVMAYMSVDWSHFIGDPYAGLTCFFGIILADFSLSDLPRKFSRLSTFISPVTMVIALFLMSYPGNIAHAATWSAGLDRFGVKYLGGRALERIYGAFGGILLIASIIISPHARWFLSQRPLQSLGEVSFAIYLVHGSLMRSVFAWVLFYGTEKRIDSFTIPTANGSPENITKAIYPLPGNFRLSVAVVVLFVATWYTSRLWKAIIEPLCAKLTNRVAILVEGKTANIRKLASSSTSLLPQSSGVADQA